MSAQWAFCPGLCTLAHRGVSSLLIYIPLNICHGFVRSCLSICLGEIVSIVGSGRGKEVVIKIFYVQLISV